MKPLWQIRNRRGKREAPRLSLFPFLAVLICTMGALMLLLLFVSRQARLQAARDLAARDADKRTKIAAEMEMLQWRVDQLKNSRSATAAQLAEARLLLGHIEDHGRRLRAQFAELAAAAKKADAEGLKPGNFAAPGEDELRRLEAQIAEAQQLLARSQQAAANRPKSYAIVPYDGPNRTRRRPIYIECRSDAVVLQPENVVFGEADFDEPLGPGNPLAAAVRAVREQMLMERNIDPQNSGEPYPLLLVRPDGIPAYECALAAMKSWGSDFGYELINADWQLKYPPSDPNVARAVAQAVELARQEHARLVAAAPSKYGSKRPRSGLYQSSLADGGDGQGGDGQGGGGGKSPGFYSTKPADRFGDQNAGNGSGSGSGSPGSSGSPRGNGYGNGSGRGGHGFGGGAGDGDGDTGENSVAIADKKFEEENPYKSIAFAGGGGVPGGPVGAPSGAGVPSGYVGAPGVAGGFAGSPASVGGAPGGNGGVPGGVGGYVAGMSGGPAGMGGSPGGISGGAGSPAGGGTGFGPAGGGSSSGGSPYAVAAGGGNAAGNGFRGGAGSGGSNNGGGSGGGSGSGGSPYAVAAGGGNAGSGDMSGGGPGGSPGTASGGMPSIYTPTFGQTGGPGDGQGGSAAGGAQGASQPGAQSNGQASYQGNGQSSNQTYGQPAGSQTSSTAAAAVERPDGYIIGRPNDPNTNPPPPQRPDPSSGVAMVPSPPLRPGEWRPTDDAPPPKPNPDDEKKKKKNPYDNIDPDRSQADWALRNAHSHAAAISRPLHVDCYADRVVIAPDQPGGEPHVIVCDGSPRRNADKLVAAIWDIMDKWGMAGKEMYWKPILNFYVVPGAEPRMVDLSRALDGSGLVIERKQ